MRAYANPTTTYAFCHRLVKCSMEIFFLLFKTIHSSVLDTETLISGRNPSYCKLEE